MVLPFICQFWLQVIFENVSVVFSTTTFGVLVQFCILTTSINLVIHYLVNSMHTHLEEFVLLFLPLKSLVEDLFNFAHITLVLLSLLQYLHSLLILSFHSVYIDGSSSDMYAYIRSTGVVVYLKNSFLNHVSSWVFCYML